MKRPRDHDEIVTTLTAMRPTPDSEFAGELDEWAAAGFPRRSTSSRSPLAALAEILSGLTPRTRSFAVAATALAAIAVATVVIASNDSRSERLALELDSAPHRRPHPVQLSESVPSTAPRSSHGAGVGNSSSETQSSAAVPPRGPQLQSSSEPVLPAGLASRGRDIERAAEIGLLAEPSDVAEDSARVFAAVHDADGIVLRSTTTSGQDAGAHFDLLIPSARLGDALAAFSAIDEVRTRHEATTDITKPTVSLQETLRDSRAEIDGLLSQLTSAETESEREAIEGELTRERRHAARLRSQLEGLEQRVDYSRVSVRIETGGASAESGGVWGVDDAFGDAGHILGIAAGVTLIGLAVIAPLALLGLLAWLAHRAWLRRARNRALA